MNNIKTFWLALGWGAARGIAHIGVIEYLEENSISISEISGTSMGALIGAAYAIWKSSDDMKEILANIHMLKLIDFDMKWGIFRGSKIEKLLDNIFWDILIEEAKIPITILATELRNWEKHIFTSGKIKEAIRASISLPSVFTPATIWEQRYLDGWLNENLPVSVLKNQDIIAVSVIREAFEWEIPTHKTILWFRVKRSFFRYNYQIMKRTIGIMMKNNEDFHIELCRTQWKNIILIAPDVSEFEYFDFMKYEAISKLGYEEAEKIFKS